jgi:hypothetical protein
MVGPGAVPVFFAVGCVDDIAGVELDELLPAGLDQAATLGDIEGLAALVRMPGSPCAWRETDGGDTQPGGRQSPGDGVHEYLSREGLGSPRARPVHQHVPGQHHRRPDLLLGSHTANLLGFERSHPQAALRIRLEDLADARQQTARAMMSFLGVAGPDSDVAPAQYSQASSEAGSSGADTGRTVRRPEIDLPADLIPPPCWHGPMICSGNSITRRCLSKVS